MSTFAFLKVEWPEVHEAAAKAELAAYRMQRLSCRTGTEKSARSFTLLRFKAVQVRRSSRRLGPQISARGGELRGQWADATDLGAFACVISVAVTVLRPRASETP